MDKLLKEKYLKQYKVELFDYCIPFWIKYGWDKQFGGLLNCLDEKGEVYSSDKSVWLQGRCAWMYAYLSNNFGKNDEFLSFSKSCLDFLDNHCFDKDGRMFFLVTRDGKPLRKRRYYFSETFYVMAAIEYYKATGDKEYLEKARRVYDLVWNIFTNPESDPFKIFPKVYPETRSTKAMACPMIILNINYIMREYDKERLSYYNDNAKKCIEEIKLHYNKQLHGMFENITLDNKFNLEVSTERIINPGHDLECAFFLAQEAKYENNKELFDFSEIVFKDAIKRGWDSQFGGIKYFVDALGYPVEAYEHDMKLWWTHNEGINASLFMYKETNDEYYLDWFIKLTDYAFSHFSEHKYGEWYGYLRRDGHVTEPPCKGHTYKGPFHVMRCLATVIKLLESMD